ncbi:hypothetical protein [Streptomyces sp. UNOB3_S3]|uniref:hypothetical protein n=1 Tax=Streptomyces sp. UNOB3_S3 TaxID=2871682 RepID=UPI001E35D98B|nr:hypothetical protein [Streptomyces sp. UNOB3_S3]MCC3775913.1 hypothetical protein [Streptomyces sp. UNOB3_S3]
MTYRNGAYVMDTRENRLAQVIGSTDARVQVQRPGGGLQWEVPVADVRLATREERDAAGLPASASPVGCAECAALVAARQEAGASGDEEKAVDAMVAVRSHFREAHVLPYWTRR